MQIYVNQHDFFISHGKVVDDADKGAEDDSADMSVFRSNSLIALFEGHSVAEYS